MHKQHKQHTTTHGKASLVRSSSPPALGAPHQLSRRVGSPSKSLMEVARAAAHTQFSPLFSPRNTHAGLAQPDLSDRPVVYFRVLISLFDPLISRKFSSGNISFPTLLPHASQTPPHPSHTSRRFGCTVEASQEFSATRWWPRGRHHPHLGRAGESAAQTNFPDAEGRMLIARPDFGRSPQH